MATKATAFERGLRRAEWFAAGLALFVFSGALFPLLLEGGDGMLDAAERSRLRMLNLPVYLLTFLFLARRPILLAIAMWRNVPMVALVLFPTVSAFWAISQSVSLRRSIALIMSMAVAYLLATRFSPRQQIVLLSGVLGGATVMSLAAAAVMPGLAMMPGEGGLRGIFIHKNVLGWVASFTVILGLAARQDLQPAMRWGGLGLIGIGAAGILLSGSATALLSALFGWLTFLTVRTIARARGMARLAAILVLALVLVSLAALLFIGLLPLLEFLGKDATLTGRVPLWHLVDAEIARRPVLGYGYGVFWSEANPIAWQIWEEVGWQAPHAHNGYRDLLLGLGLVGLALFLIVALRALQQGTGLCSAAPHDGWLWCVATIGTALAMNLSESTFLMQNDLMWTLFSTAAITLSLRHAQLRPAIPRHSRLQHAAV